MPSALAAMAQERLYQRDSWIVAHTPADSPASSPFCLAVTLAEDRPDQSLSLAVFGDGSAVLSVSGLGEEASAPSAVPSVLEIGGSRWALNWEAGEVAAYVAIEQRATAERLAGQLAQG